MLLENITGAEDVRKLSLKEQKILAKEVRRFIIEKMSDNGGHLASNLGVVELTIALFHALNLPKDKIVWDVGHQCYTHKILSGRRDDFALLRKFKGISGFPKREESPYDCFNTGHSSTSISAALGIAEGRDLLGEDYTVVSVIGDGALTGGMAYEALNNASKMKKNFIIILNDNEMSIAKNVGGMSTYLNGIRSHKGYTRFKENLASGLGKIPLVGNRLVERLKNTKNSIKQLLVPGMLFENMGLTYLGPVDGHNLHALEQVIHEAKRIDHAVLVHVVTKKGKGYAPAEKNPSVFHGVGPFDIATGKSKKESTEKSYTDIFAESLIKEGKEDSRFVAITAAMPDGTGLNRFEKLFPKRFFDVGIAEAHAVTSAAGLASAGLKPVFAVYSSFLQRAYDQIVHDVCLQKLPVVFAIDRAGLVGADGETHQGIFDISFLRSIPNMTVMAPKNARELTAMLHFALQFQGPIAIRYPRGAAYQGFSEKQEPIEYGKAEILIEDLKQREETKTIETTERTAEQTAEQREKQTGKIALLALGSMVSTGEHIVEKMAKKGVNLSLVNARFAKPIDTEMLDKLSEKGYRKILTLEEGVRSGGFGEAVLSYMETHHKEIAVENITLPDSYVEHGDVSTLRKMLKIDSDSIIEGLEVKGFFK